MSTSPEDMKKFINERFGALDRKISTIIEEPESSKQQNLSPITVEEFVCFLEIFYFANFFCVSFAAKCNGDTC